MMTKDRLVQIQATMLRLEVERHNPGFLRNAGVDTEQFQNDVDNAIKWLRAEIEPQPLSASELESFQRTITQAGALLIDAAGMLRLEAQEWLDRKGTIAPGKGWSLNEWKERCERIAAINRQAADKMSAVAKKLAKL